MFIYVIRNTINQKVYVGQDSGSIDDLRRIRTHFLEADRVHRLGSQFHYQSAIRNAIVKYGADAFEVEIPFSDVPSVDALNCLEIELIKKLDSVANGYNIHPGGEGFPPNSLIDDPSLLAALHDQRSRGAKTRNKTYWENTTVEERYDRCKPMFENRGEAWRANVKKSWDNLSEEDYKERCLSMSRGKQFIFEFDYHGRHEKFHNLRKILPLIEDNDLIDSRKKIEKTIREHGLYECPNFKITRLLNHEYRK